MNGRLHADDIKNKLYSIVNDNPKDWTLIAQEMDVAFITLIRFLEGHNVRYKTMCKMNAWINNQK